MAEMPIQVNGVLWNKVWKRGEPVVLYGMASIVGLEIGGGPIMPPDQGGGGGEPGIPTFPIAGYPDFPYPSQPIYRPGYPGGSPPPNLRPPEQPPEGPADENGFIKPPPEGGGWAYHEDYGWMYSPGGQSAGPKSQQQGSG